MTMHVLASERDRIGPNAILQVMASVAAIKGRPALEMLFAAAGMRHYLDHRPQDMVSQADVALLQLELRTVFGSDSARDISWDAGLRTGDYLLAHRIPKLAQRILKFLPAGLAARILAKAIARHSWTFAGTGTFSYRPGRPFVFSIQHNPICSRIKSDKPVCDYYAATFERIFRAIVHPNACVKEIACEAAGDPACVFELSW